MLLCVLSLCRVAAHRLPFCFVVGCVMCATVSYIFRDRIRSPTGLEGNIFRQARILHASRILCRKTHSLTHILTQLTHTGV